MVTAELAAGLPVLAVILAFAISLVVVVSARVRCADAAREAARAAARGTPAVRTVPGGGRTDVVVSSGRVVATTRVTVHPLGGLLPAVTVTERAVAALEPGVATP